MHRPSSVALVTRFVRHRVFTCFASFFFVLTGANVGAHPGAEESRFPDSVQWSMTENPVDVILNASKQQLEHWATVNRETRRRDYQRLRSDRHWDQHRQTLREFLADVCGVDDYIAKDSIRSPEVVSGLDGRMLLSAAPGVRAVEIRWQVSDGLTASGLMLTPAKGESTSTILLLPDADQSPVEWLSPQDTAEELTLAESLALRGAQVFIPLLTGRSVQPGTGRVQLSCREYIHRSAWLFGKSTISYEVSAALQLLNSPAVQSIPGRPVAIAGYGEGCRVALMTAALSDGLAAVVLSGGIGPREAMSKEPLDRNRFGLLKRLGDAEIVGLIDAPVLVEAGNGPDYSVTGNGAAPGQLRPIPFEQASRELCGLLQESGPNAISLQLVSNPAGDFSDSAEHPEVIRFLTAQLGLDDFPDASESTKPLVRSDWRVVDFDQRHSDWIASLEREHQRDILRSRKKRNQWRSALPAASPEEYEAAIVEQRRLFEEQWIGVAPQDEQFQSTVQMRPYRQTPEWEAFEVLLSTSVGIPAYGLCLVPRNMASGERRPVVVCQHGLEGRPRDTIEGDHRAYHDYAARLCERGYVVFCPQNLYIEGDRFRFLQRQANPLGLTLFSLIIPQHRAVVDWLSRCSFVDSSRIAFYGLSYGGKSAMRIPAVMPEYCLSICSADFNEWVLKNVSTQHDFSYVRTGEYEIFEYNLAENWNYAEMAALICPRPFMVERGHFDGVGIDEWVAFEYARVRFLYAALLGIPERTEIEWFVGPHTINGRGTFDFLDRHLRYTSDR